MVQHHEDSAWQYCLPWPEGSFGTIIRRGREMSAGVAFVAWYSREECEVDLIARDYPPPRS